MSTLDSVYIRPMTSQDYDDVTQLWTATDGIFLADAEGRSGLSAYLKRNPTTSFVAMMDQQIVGAVLCGHDGRRASLHHLAVDVEHRRKGIGRTLVNACMEALTLEGISTSYIFVLRSNAEAIDFWSRLGWQVQDSFAAYKRDE